MEKEVLWLDFPLKKVKSQQLLIKKDQFPKQYDTCVLNIVGGLKYRFSRAEWKKFHSLGEGLHKQKIIRLGMLTRYFTLSESQQLFLDEPSLNPSLEMEVEDQAVEVLVEKNELSLAFQTTLQPVSLLTDEEGLGLNDHEHFLRYVSILFDYHLLKEELDHSYLTTRSEKMWNYVLRQSQIFDYNRLSFIFIATLISVEQGIENPFLVNLWLETEVTHFRRAISLPTLTYRESFLSKILPLHLDRMKECPQLARQWQHASWHDFVLPDGVFWVQNGQQYLVSSFWLVRMGQITYIPDGERNGCIWIREATFDESFLPSLYECYLRDLVEMLRYQTLVKPSDYPEYYGTFPLKKLRWYFLEGPLSKIHDLSSADIHEFNLCQAKNHSSPVMKLFIKVPGLEDSLTLTQNRKKKHHQSKSHLFEKSGLPSDLLDIEDLFEKPEKLLPPCLAGLVEKSKKDWCKYKDRLTLVRYLVDMGYGEESGEQIVELMSVNRNNAIDRSGIETLVKSHVKKKESQGGGIVSVYCGTIINSTNTKEEIIRCEYEKEMNGEKRMHCTDEEKRTFTSKCACSVGLKSMNHPLDYIQQKTLLL